jgi:hypothetical protein
VTTQEKVAAMSETELRERLAEINQFSKLGDYSWDYDELVLIEERIPEEKAAVQRTFTKSRRAAERKYRTKK